MPTSPLPSTGELFALARHIDGERAVEQAARLGDGLSAEARAAATLLATAYPATAGPLAADPALAPTSTAMDCQALRTELAAYGAESEATFRRELRRLAARERLRIALGELLPPQLGGLAFTEAARELSELADLTISAALAVAERLVFASHGQPRSPTGRAGRLVVLGMGKLGGLELNPGSDVDLVCFYDSDDCTTQHRIRGSVSAHEVWSRVVQLMASLLGDVSEHGFVWRVDLRLRPEGSRGPLVNSLAAAERYYETFGRLWERAAWIRARPVAGDLDLGRELLAALRPFIWRRRVQPALAVSLYQLGERARAELSRGDPRNLKHAAGGIRDVELFVQVLQLIWGGREARIRVRPIMQAIERLESAGLVTARESHALAAAYVALRRAEHAVQHSRGTQTHTLPTSEADGRRLARALRLDDGQALVAHLACHGTEVQTLVRALLPAAPATSYRWQEALAALDRRDAPRFARALAAAGLAALIAAPHGELARDLYDLAELHVDGLLGAGTRERHAAAVETLLDAIADSVDPVQAAHYLRRFATHLPHPGLYTERLAHDHAAMYRLVTVLGGSAFVGEAVASRPELVDLVLFAPPALTAEQARAEVLQSVAAAPAHTGDEQLVGLLRRAKQRAVARVALADLRGEITVRESTLALSAVADATVELAVRAAVRADLSAPAEGLAVLAMGSLGGREVGYGSDLDLIFIHGEERPSDGARTDFARAAKRVIRIITMPHPDGRGYAIDTRLRPSGRQGLLVVSLRAFAHYHHLELAPPDGARASPAAGARAATWERLALLKARRCAGDPELGNRAVAIARHAAYGAQADRSTVAREIHRLRLRMLRELAREQAGRYDLKLGSGGLVEVELAVQFLQLVHGANESVRTSSTARAITALEAIGALKRPHAAALAEGHDWLRSLEQRLRIVHGESSRLIEEGAAGLPPLARRMGLVDSAGAPAQDRLLAHYRAVTSLVHQAYQRIVVDAIDDGGI